MFLCRKKNYLANPSHLELCLVKFTVIYIVLEIMLFYPPKYVISLISPQKHLRVLIVGILTRRFYE